MKPRMGLHACNARQDKVVGRGKAISGSSRKQAWKLFGTYPWPLLCFQPQEIKYFQ